MVKDSVLRPVETALAGIGLMGWVLLFGAGLTVDTLPYRYRISPASVEAVLATRNVSVDSAQGQHLTFESGTVVEVPRSIVSAWFVVLCCATPTNILGLSLLAGVLGALGRRAQLHSGDAGVPGWDNVNPNLSGLMRGFFVFLTVIAGLMLLVDDPFANPSAQQYLRLAGLISVVSFLVNYNPRIFGNLYLGVSHFVERAVPQRRDGTDLPRGADGGGTTAVGEPGRESTSGNE